MARYYLPEPKEKPAIGVFAWEAYCIYDDIRVEDDFVPLHQMYSASNINAGGLI